MTRKMLLWLPFVLVTALFAAFFLGLRHPDDHVIASQMVGKPLPDFAAAPAFPGRPGAATADFRDGHPRLLNIFASWCVPCRAEMPALAALAKKFDGPDFMVLPINLDIGSGGLAKDKAFLASAGIEGLPLYADPSLSALDRLKDSAVALGLPASLLLDRKACEVAVLQGPAKWDSADGDNVIKALVALKG